LKPLKWLHFKSNIDFNVKFKYLCQYKMLLKHYLWGLDLRFVNANLLLFNFSFAMWMLKRLLPKVCCCSIDITVWQDLSWNAFVEDWRSDKTWLSLQRFSPGGNPIFKKSKLIINLLNVQYLNLELSVI